MENINVKMYKVSEEAEKQYRETGRGNERLPKHVVGAKLSRNIALAFNFPDGESQNDQLFIYGNMYIYVNNEMVTHIENHKGDPHNFHDIDYEKRAELNKYFKIRDDKPLTYLVVSYDERGGIAGIPYASPNRKAALRVAERNHNGINRFSEVQVRIGHDTVKLYRIGEIKLENSKYHTESSVVASV